MIPVKVCGGPCGRRLPASYDYFGTSATRADGTKRLRPKCRDCTRAEVREASRRYREMLKQPEMAWARERTLKKQRDRMKRRYERDPKERSRASSEYRRRRRVDAGYRKAERERMRIQHRLDREREGVALEDVSAKPGLMKNAIRTDHEGEAFPRLPAFPLGQALLAEDRKRRREHYAGCLVDFEADRDDLAGVHAVVPGWSSNADRSIRAWAVGERLDVNFDVVDRVLTALDWCWWEVYNERTVRRYALAVTYRQPSTSVKIGRHRKLPTEMMCRFALDEHGIYGSPLPNRAAKYITPRRSWLGDLGPDPEALERVAHAFECTGYPSCQTCRDAREREPQMVLEVAA
jgi:hypothetical protein